MTEQRIHFLSESKTDNSKYILFPLKLYQQQLKKKFGIHVKIIHCSFESKRITQCDQLWINSKVLRSYWGNKSKSAESILESLNKRTRRLVYIDTTDSSGTLQTGALPFVHKYLKSYILKDPDIYKNTLYGGRIFTDYYHKKYHITDEQSKDAPVNAPVLDSAHLKKLELFWNPVLGYKRNLFFPNMARFFYKNPEQIRQHFVSCRIGTNYSRETVAFQRKQILATLSAYKLPTNKISYRSFKKELNNSLLSISPFGYGEFAYRDFESIKSGCILIKPSMDHLQTWPDIYQPMKTYVPVTWDLDDLVTLLEQIQSSPTRYTAIASNAQQLLSQIQHTPTWKDSFLNFFWRLHQSIENATL